MAFIDVKLPFLGSIETLLADVQSITSSEMSLKQLAALIEDEFHMERYHMEKKNDSQNYAFGNISFSEVKSNLLSVVKWVICILIMIIVALILSPMRTSESLYAFTESLADLPIISSIKSSTPPSHSLDDIDWLFYAMKLIRKGSTTLKLESKYPNTMQYVDGCILSNPLFVPEETVDCKACRNINGFRISSDDYNFVRPTVKENQNVSFSLGRLQQVLRRNEIMVNQHTVSIETNRDYIHSVEDLKYNHVLEQLVKDSTFHFAGNAVSYMSSHILRNEFPRPQDYTDNAAQNYMNYFFIDGKNSSTFRLQRKDIHFMYVQASGSRRLVFAPDDLCQQNCTTFSRIMKTGDIVFYGPMWTVDSEATKDKSISIAFVDIFEEI